MGGLHGALVREKILCRDPTKNNGVFEIFRGLSSLMMRVDHDPGGPLAPLPPSSPPPRPPCDDDRDGDEEEYAPSLNTVDWDMAGSKSKVATTGGASLAAVVSSGLAGHAASLVV